MQRGMAKEKIVEAAAWLFHMNGFNGTTVREIAARANVNGALISYHFGGKKELFEQLSIPFFEGYIEIVDRSLEGECETVAERLHLLIRQLLAYQTENLFIARMVHRELTHDSTFVREIMATYLRKEMYQLERLVKLGMKRGEFQKQPVQYIVIQIRSFITMPYMSPHYFQEVYQLNPSDRHFIDRYLEHIKRVIKRWLCSSIESHSSA
ncbi:forespore capture DNA-binding protein RefZ [Halalkalibacter sp. APA_J-10(15)]|uniref:forespore capture DNA-binding protein RefZ n=1 Tax=unclassified Halalkalibacter TaxID=2893063 RepID=UPI001FF13396|nr:forespore capture DNA-binding protein RefZ [Halalkalibacter sp. APA_J-10(15)]MCK0471310.1 forespore capture DNA-binding protein RefZ [Halalkalibacter sp. APA_J-10(15)]